MNTVTKRLYEGLFLVDSNEAASDWKGINAAIEKALTRNGAEVVSLTKWDDRRLAYEVDGKSRGTYILTYFNCDTAKIAPIERDVQLSEQIMRVMILRTDKMSQDDISADTPAAIAEKKVAIAQEKAAIAQEKAAAAVQEKAAAAESEPKAAESEAETPKAIEPEEEPAEASVEVPKVVESEEVPAESSEEAAVEADENQ